MHAWAQRAMAKTRVGSDPLQFSRLCCDLLELVVSLLVIIIGFICVAVKKD